MPIRPLHYYWIVAFLEGEPYLIEGGPTEEIARQKAFESNLTNFEIRDYPTRNQAMASSLMRGNTLEKTKDLKTAVKRIRHKLRKRKKEIGD